MSGKVVHFEIPADDVERAQQFYREAFGWQITPMPEMQYTMVGTTPSDPNTGAPTEVGGINGGMMKRQGPVTAPVVTIEVADIDEALSKIEQLGGKTVTGRTPVGDMGFSGYFSDSEGNVVGIWQNAG